MAVKSKYTGEMTHAAIMAYLHTCKGFDVTREYQTRIAHNTHFWYNPYSGAVSVRFHLTDIVTYEPNDIVRLDSGGWYTVTTKARMNQFSPVMVYQSDFDWYVSVNDHAGKDLSFYDGFEFYNGTIDIDNVIDAVCNSPRYLELLMVSLENLSYDDLHELCLDVFWTQAAIGHRENDIHYNRYDAVLDHCEELLERFPQYDARRFGLA